MKATFSLSASAAASRSSTTARRSC